MVFLFVLTEEDKRVRSTNCVLFWLLVFTAASKSAYKAFTCNMMLGQTHVLLTEKL